MKDSHYDIMNLIKAFDFEFNTKEHFSFEPYLSKHAIIKGGVKGLATWLKFQFEFSSYFLNGPEYNASIWPFRMSCDESF